MKAISGRTQRRMRKIKNLISLIEKASPEMAVINKLYAGLITMNEARELLGLAESFVDSEILESLRLGKYTNQGK